MQKSKLYSAIIASIAAADASAVEAPEYGKTEHGLMLAEDYQGQLLNDDFMISEKLDGIRAIWDGEKLTTRAGTLLNAPDYFIEQLPPFAVEGELWVARQRYQQVQKIVLDEIPDQLQWRTITYSLFDRLYTADPFIVRYQSLLSWQKKQEITSQVNVLVQTPFISNAHLKAELEHIIQLGGEGVIVRRASQVYLPGRAPDLYKIKPHLDAEAKVIGYREGKGKYKDQIGALWVEANDGTRFYVGSGLSDFERENPPAIGSIITYRYNGKTNRGVPRFSRFLRVRLVY